VSARRDGGPVHCIALALEDSWVAAKDGRDHHEPIGPSPLPATTFTGPNRPTSLRGTRGLIPRPSSECLRRKVGRGIEDREGGGAMSTDNKGGGTMVGLGKSAGQRGAYWKLQQRRYSVSRARYTKWIHAS
jgi:hypothetical protein